LSPSGSPGFGPALLSLAHCGCVITLHLMLDVSALKL
jgi:hypothetical protein